MSLTDKKENAKKFFSNRRKAISENLINSIQESVLTINRYIIQKLNKFNKSRKMKIWTAGILGAVVLCILFSMNLRADVYLLKISGQEIGYIENKQMLAKAAKEVSVELSKSSGGLAIKSDQDAWVCEATDLKAKGTTFLTEKELKQKLIGSDIFKAEAWAININGRNVVAASSKKEADSILEGVKNRYRTEASELISAAFKEKVTVTKAAVNIKQVMKPEDAVKFLATGAREPKTYIVKDGDTIWDIAKAVGMKPGELENANPGLNPDRIKIGQKLNLFEVKPYVTVITKEIVTAEERIDFQTVYQNTDALYKGEVKIKTAGVYGTREVKYEITKENDKAVASNVIESKVAAEPQTQIALKGTKLLSTYAGSGILSKPLKKIDVSSAFGVNRGSNRHTGVDLRSPKGTPILAADDGVVTFAGYSGTYGNLVKISHGNGMETWYAHANTLNVSVGEKVSRGQQIATVGMTGRTTGYHLHFMVSINGVMKNPMRYI